MSAPHKKHDTRMQVLVVEDSIPFAKLVIAKLKRGLTMPHEVHHVDCVREGVAALQDHSIDLIILDMHLPDASGMETFEAIYGAAPEIPIVILSSDDTEELAMEAVSRGAQDYLIKGEDDTHKLMWSIRFAMERKKRLHAEGELQAARKIQESLLPERAPQIKGYDVHGAMFPAVETAGDYYDFIIPMPAIGKDVDGIVVGDVSGHGLGPAMMMAETRGCLHAFALLEADVAKLLKLTNEVLSRNRNEHFVTLMLGYIDEATRRFRYASAGHQACHISAAGEVTLMEATGTVLGIVPDETWDTAESPELSSGDLLVIMTDGISEAMTPSGEMYGDDRLFDFLKKNQQQSAGEIVKRLRNELIEFTGARPQQDDMTMVIVRVTE